MMRAIKLPSVADLTCLSSFEVPTRNIATVASAIGLPAWSLTMPLITPRLVFAETDSAGGTEGPDAKVTGAAAATKISDARDVFFNAVAIIEKRDKSKAEGPGNVLSLRPFRTTRLFS